MLRILITEDDEILIGLYRSLLKSMSNCCTSFARTAEESRSKIDEEHFDLALFDINLGIVGEEGIELLDYISTHDPDTITVMMSTQDDPKTRARCAVAHSFVTKNGQFAINLADQLQNICREIQPRFPAQCVA